MSTSAQTNLDRLQDTHMTMSVALGHADMELQDLLELGEQSLIELDRLVDQPVEVQLNGKLFGRGQVVTMGEHFGVRLTQISGSAQD
tara:strand:- start:266 stop:526 length:261 start_codon:yes stop_codon:yes gene_type:complete